MLQQHDIKLRPLAGTDAAVLAALANNKKISDNLRDFFPHPYTRDDAVSFIKMTSLENPPMTFGILHKDELCGVIGLIGQPDVYRKTAEIGYWIGEPYWNKGIATIAVKLLTDYGLNQLGFVRIHTGIFEYNTSSMKVLEKNGYNKDGVFEKAVLKNGKLWDEHRYSKTRFLTKDEK